MITTVCQQICGSKNDVEKLLSNLKLTACPHCKRFGNLIRHGVLRGCEDQPSNSVRAYRIFCSNRNRARGCGRTFSIYLANKIKRLSLDATQLWAFLKKVALGVNKLEAFRSLSSELSDSAPYRIWKRFLEAQSSIRTQLFSLCRPPNAAQQQPEQGTLVHLEAAFAQHPLGPVAAFQLTLQTFFV